MITVVIPAHNAAATLAEQLDAVLAQEFDEPFEVLVIDNNSTDTTAALVLEYCRRDPRVLLQTNADGRGPSYARNAGIAAARSERIACCDADDIVASGWLSAMNTALEKHQAVAGVLEVASLNDAAIVAARGTTVGGTAGNFLGITFAHGACFGIRRSTYHAVGGFDESLRAGEEIDLAIRLLAHQVEFVETPDAIVHYRYRTDPKDQWNQAFENGRIKPYVSKLSRDTQGLNPSRVEGLRNWVWLVRNVPKLKDPVVRLRWRWVLASRCGQIAGCVRYKTVYL